MKEMTRNARGQCDHIALSFESVVFLLLQRSRMLWNGVKVLISVPFWDWFLSHGIQWTSLPLLVKNIKNYFDRSAPRLHARGPCQSCFFGKPWSLWEDKSKLLRHVYLTSSNPAHPHLGSSCHFTALSLSSFLPFGSDGLAKETSFYPTATSPGPQKETAKSILSLSLPWPKHHLLWLSSLRVGGNGGIGVELGRVLPACSPATSEPPPQPSLRGLGSSPFTFLAIEV